MRFGAFVGILAGISCLACGPVLAADDAAVLSPSSAWAMNYDDDSCALQRLFGTSGNEVLLEFRRFSPASGMQIAVTSNGIKRSISRLRYRFDPAGEWQVPDNVLRYALGKEFEGFVFSGSILPDDREDDDSEGDEPQVDTADAALLAEAFAKASSFSVRGGFQRPITLKTGALLPPHQAMEKCLDELLTHWGIDAEAHKTLTRNAAPASFMRIAQRFDYPPSMMSQPGLVRIRLAINENGGVTGCHIQLGVSNPMFEQSACADLKGGRFHPALDKDGRPIASYWVNAIVYQP
jgi:hypothetical protein